MQKIIHFKGLSICFGLLLSGSLIAHTAVFSPQNEPHKLYRLNESLTNLATNAEAYYIQSIHSNLRAAVLQAVPEMRQAKTDWERAIILRNHVYSKNKVSLPAGELPIPLTIEKYKAVVSGQSPQLCTGMALVYIGLLQAFEIPSRIVNVATSETVNHSQSTDSLNVTNPKTHSTVEVFLDNRWVLQDPTFNIQWELEDKPLGVLELRQAFRSGKNPIPITNGHKLLPKRSVQEYHTPYQSLLSHVEISTIEVLDPRKAGSFKIVATMPPGPTWRYAVESSPLVSSSKDEIGARVRSWNFIKDLSKGWDTLPEAKVSKSSDEQGVLIKTDAFNGHYQLWSAPENLPPGDYQVRVKGTVLDGGLYIGILDATTERFISTGYYWSGQRDRFANSDMMAKFSLKEKKPIKIILANWSYEMKPSTWNLKNVAIAKDKTVSSKQ